MSEIDDGGLAFPSEYYAEQGMTLRDYFAAAALQGYFGTPHYCDCEKLALYMYQMADAMIKARKGDA